MLGAWADALLAAAAYVGGLGGERLRQPSMRGASMQSDASLAGVVSAGADTAPAADADADAAAPAAAATATPAATADDAAPAAVAAR